jgi:hypothetical protein
MPKGDTGEGGGVGEVAALGPPPSRASPASAALGKGQGHGHDLVRVWSQLLLTSDRVDWYESLRREMLEFWREFAEPFLNQTAELWHSVAQGEKTRAVRSERSRASDEAISWKNKDCFATLAMTLRLNLTALPHREEQGNRDVLE